MIPRPEDPDAPKYWMNETSGVLKPIMRRLLSSEMLPLNPLEIAHLREYFRQWVDSPAWDQNPTHSAQSL
jgi:hypothetical protein